MDLLREFLRGKSPARLIMLAAIVLLFVSQFFLYVADPGEAMLGRMTDVTAYTSYNPFQSMHYGTGWELHPWAYVILPLLGLVFVRDDVVDIGWFSRFGWWVAVALILAATFPGRYLSESAIGGSMGGIALLLGILAAAVHVAEARADTARRAAAETSKQ